MESIRPKVTQSKQPPKEEEKKQAQNTLPRQNKEEGKVQIIKIPNKVIQNKVDQISKQRDKAIKKLENDNRKEELKVSEESKIDGECPICLNVMAEPTKLSCNHRFCIQCLGKTFISNKQCPLCRKKIHQSLKVDIEFQKLVKINLPKAYEKQIALLDSNGILFADQIKLQFEIGNRCEDTDWRGGKQDRWYKAWTAFVRLKDPKLGKLSHIIKQLKIELHESYRDPVRWVKEEKDNEFQFPCKAWGTFDLGIIIYWTKKTGLTEPLTINHYLSFDDPGKWKTYEVNMSMKKLKTSMPELNKLSQNASAFK